MILPKASLSIPELVNTELLAISYEAWLKCRDRDVSKKFVVTEILVFDFELFISGRCELLSNIQIQYTYDPVDAVQ